MAKKITQKELKHDEFVEAAFDFGQWLEEHWVPVASGLGLALLLIVSIVLWNAWSRERTEAAQERLAQAIDRYEDAQGEGFSDVVSLSAALEQLDKSVADLSGAPGRVARFYRGAAFFHLDRLDEAKSDLERVVADSGAGDTVGGTAQLMLARVEAAAGRDDEAVALLQSLVDLPDSAVPPARAMLEIGRLHHEAGRADEARQQWERVIEEHPQSVAATEARALLP